ncbi:carbonic anhydrase [Neobacillus sp. MM2021_6]|uniref:carbonic anhydrase n=1 Tax=Bacillaceae TaxID=186817 RepID=UPI00140C8AB9|nr:MULTISPECIES: carbonic anhydrase [Bacillaceae]MBO0962424.1 carbonic anhydrase [Neobacillus sp. MM2021_6]NHC18910.1 carbonic anhydrase [Bacillus sp. MM2020_4]
MSRDEKKKVLYVIGMDHKLERFIKKETNVNPENIMILQRYQPLISHPLDEIMRDIIIAVFKENVEEIVVAFTDDYQKNTENILIHINKNKELKDKIQTLEYLFNNTKPEFPTGTVSEWLQGGKTLRDGVQKTVHTIRHHPLLPSHVKVKELFIKQDNEKLTGIVV